MNNGNLLNSLLGITGANSAVTKSTAAKARAESGEKFQQALEQARPEVAARKPVAVRKESVAERASEAKAAAPRDSRPEVAKTEARPKPRAAEQNNQPTNNEASSTEKAVTAASTSVKAKTTNSDHDAKATEGQLSDAQVDTDTSETQVAIDPSSLLLVAPTADTPVGELTLDTEALALPLDEATDPANGAEAALLNPELLVSVTDPATESLNAGLSPLVAGVQATLVQAGIGQANATQLADDQSLALQATTDKVLGDLATEQPIAQTETEAEGDLTNELDSGDNPDLLFLNSKAALNKSAEASANAKVLDQPAPSAEAAKPAALAAAVESLTRLSEAQSPAGRAFVVQTGVPVTVGSPQWSQAVGDKVLWLAAQNVSSAEIRLDPPELGALQVKVSVNQDQTSITFTSPHPAVREVLDQQLHRLREMFSESGLNLVNVDVSEKSFAQQEKEQKESSGTLANGDAEDEELVPVGVSQAISMRLVDHYA